jgi:hypothetical protein
VCAGKDWLNMKKFYLLLISLSSLHLSSTGQTESSVNRMVSLIKTIPEKYSTHYNRNEIKSILNKQDDGWFKIIVKYDTNVIPFLINLIGDGTPSMAFNTCSNANYRTGDVAILLINDIEQIPYATVTHSQWCTFGQCGVLPDGFFYYTNAHRRDFQEQYKTYYSGKERQDILREKRRRQKLRNSKL